MTTITLYNYKENCHCTYCTDIRKLLKTNNHNQQEQNTKMTTITLYNYKENCHCTYCTDIRKLLKTMELNQEYYKKEEPKE